MGKKVDRWFIRSFEFYRNTGYMYWKRSIMRLDGVEKRCDNA